MELDGETVGLPHVNFRDAQATIEALAGTVEGMVAYATDLDQLGFYTGSVWVWIPRNVTDLEDVQISSPNDGDSIVYDSAISKWIAAAVEGGGGSVSADWLSDLEDVFIAAPGPDGNDVLYYDGDTQRWVAGQIGPLNWDNVRIVHKGGTQAGTFYNSIQDAHDAADTGDTIVVCPGVYTEDLTFSKEVNLVGLGVASRVGVSTYGSFIEGRITISGSCSFSNMGVDYSFSTASETNGIYVTGQAWFRNCSIYYANGSTGILHGIRFDSNANQAWLINCVIYIYGGVNGTYGVEVEDGTLTMVGCDVSSSGVTAYSAYCSGGTLRAMGTYFHITGAPPTYFDLYQTGLGSTLEIMGCTYDADYVQGTITHLDADATLAALKTVDGPGSGLNADLLDGLDSGDFSLTGHDHDADYSDISHNHSGVYAPIVHTHSYVAKSGDNMTGVLRLDANSGLIPSAWRLGGSPLEFDFTSSDYNTYGKCATDTLRLSGGAYTLPDDLYVTVTGGWTHTTSTGWGPQLGTLNEGPAMLVPLMRPGNWDITVAFNYAAQSGARLGELVIGYLTGEGGRVGAFVRAHDNSGADQQLQYSLFMNNGDDTYGAVVANSSGVTSGDFIVSLECKNGYLRFYDDVNDSWTDFTARNGIVPYTPAYLFLQVKDTHGGLNAWSIKITSLSVTYFP